MRNRNFDRLLILLAVACVATASMAQITGSVHGTKWLDDNGNGQRDTDEPGLAGVTIYADANFNGVLDSSEPRAVTMADDPNTSFDESGMYWLDGVAGGRHALREVVPDGFVQTFPPTGAHEVDLGEGEILEGLDFGNQPIRSASIHGTKWLDRNGNSERDSDEPGLGGVILDSDLNNNTRLDTDEPRTLTMRDDPVTDFDEEGLYWLEVEPGKHRVREVIPDGFLQTFPADGLHEVALASGDTIDGLDFGNQAVGSGSLHGRKWQDDNGNGEHDTNEPGLAGVTIYIDSNFNGELDSGEPRALSMEDDPATAFDESGLYWFEAGVGRYLIREVVPEGFEQTFPPGRGHEVALADGQAIEGLDFGNQPVHPGSIHGRKWQDDNGNGERDSDEPGLPGVTLYVDRNFNGTLDAGDLRTVSMQDDPVTDFDEAGLYWITEVEPGRNVIREVVPDGFEQTFPPDGAHGIDLGSGETIDGLDFGNLPIRPASFHGRKWLDRNGNSTRESDEPGLPGVTIYVDTNFNGELEADEPRTVSMRDDPATTFDEAGLYWITEVEPGRHVIREVVPDGFRQTFPRTGEHEVNVTSGQSVDGLDFGNQPAPAASIHGTKWNDLNANARRDEGEPGLPGFVIYLDLNDNARRDDGEPWTVTMEDDPATDFDEAGLYWIGGLEPGTYLVREVRVRPFKQTFPTSGFHAVTLEAGESADGIDFGNRRPGRRWRQ